MEEKDQFKKKENLEPENNHEKLSIFISLLSAIMIILSGFTLRYKFQYN